MGGLYPEEGSVIPSIMADGIPFRTTAECGEVWSPLGSELAIKTLGDYGVGYHFTESMPHIQNRSGEGMCPMERLSIGKSPEEFYEIVRHLIKKH